MAATLTLRNNLMILRLEQDQNHDRWIPLEDEDAVPHKRTYDFLIFLGKDPRSENFCITTEELNDIVGMRFAIELQGCRGMLLENNIKTEHRMIRWKDHVKNRFVGIIRSDRGRYGAPIFGRNFHNLWEKAAGLVSEREPRNINR